MRHLLIGLKPHLIVEDASLQPVAYPASPFRTTLEIKGIVEHLVLPNLETLVVGVEWSDESHQLRVNRDYEELAGELRCLRRFENLSSLHLDITGARDHSTFDYTVRPFLLL